MISAILAMSQNRVIARKGKLPWHIPDDLKFFKETTLGHPIIMGRKSFDALGKPLPGRTNIVITRKKNWNFPGTVVVTSLEEALDVASKSPGNDEIFVTGGAEIFAQALPCLDRFYLTLIHENYEGETILPSFEAQFETTASRHVDAPVPHTFLTLNKLKNC